jgi:hypothetical protein
MLIDSNAWRILRFMPKRFCTPPLSEILLSSSLYTRGHTFHLALDVVHVIPP